MWEDILKLAMSNGLWAVLFLGLLIYQLRDSSAREKKYQNTIDKLNDHLEVVNDIKNEVSEIASFVYKKSKKEKKPNEKV